MPLNNGVLNVRYAAFTEIENLELATFPAQGQASTLIAGSRRSSPFCRYTPAFLPPRRRRFLR